jgi:hypothetical protein
MEMWHVIWLVLMLGHHRMIRNVFQSVSDEIKELFVVDVPIDKENCVVLKHRAFDPVWHILINFLEGDQLVLLTVVWVNLIVLCW